MPCLKTLWKLPFLTTTHRSRALFFLAIFLLVDVN